MRRREFIALMSASVTLPFVVLAQEPGRTYRLGVLLPHPRDVPVNVAFLEEFRRNGFIEGQNFAVDWHAYGQDLGLLPQYAAELVSARVDVITTAGEEALRAAQQATKTIPIVAIMDDLQGLGDVQSLARPEGNTTGVSVLAGDLDGKRQELLIEAVPGLRRLAALEEDVFNNKTASLEALKKEAAKLEALQEAARAHNVELSIYRVGSGEEIAPAIDAARAWGATALNIFAGPLVWAHRQLIIDRAAALHLPTMHQFPEEAEEGAFAGYGARLGQLFLEMMPPQIIKLFRGAKVADVPVERPTKFELVINLKTANAMGVTVDPSLLARADKLIE
jgi:putative tryptophan/tyrosine transport system substrate-binding protein